ncbi:hypothetical protein XM38_030490 [Halomicronema hongdechloris C2206]|uniref:Uncharacterized protein n=1 Tax=Halomicronema hongdechloris C2206 TaxID=1641165 RepID=A0A1Z3HP78_9CYAN|nr:hypothetical protein [Halomicronema hongdechloris]ASC72095.1 hypothetical protein XM38_030490 [Halomicronema hongdechloris C2206]
MTVSVSRDGYWTAALAAIKSFLIWLFILEVCLLVIGFPLVVLIVAGAATVAIALHPLMPASALLIVASTTIGLNFIAIATASLVLTARGIHPHTISWLNWLKSEADPLTLPVYAACPLTCGLQRDIL